MLDVDWQRIFEPSLGLVEIIVRGSLMYLALFAILRFIARRQTGSMGPADLLVIVLVADASANAFGRDYTSVTEGVALVLTIVAWEYLIDWLQWRYPALRPVFQPPPLKLVVGGYPVRKNLRKEMITEEDLATLLRQKGIADRRRVETARLEGDGQLSVLERKEWTGPYSDAATEPTPSPARSSPNPQPGVDGMDTLEQLFEDTLRDIYYAEKAILKNLPKMAKKASSEQLASAFEEHIDQTEEQVARLEQIFEMIGKSARGSRCPAIDGLAEEASELMQEAKDDTVRDAGMLAAAQAVEHYEIARYGALAAWAEKLGMEKAIDLLRTTLEEEKATDQKLTELALTEINIEADVSQEPDAQSRSRNPRRKQDSRSTARRA